MVDSDIPNGALETAQTPSHHSISCEASAQPTPAMISLPHSMDANDVPNGIPETTQTSSHHCEPSAEPTPPMIPLPDSRASTPARDATSEKTQPIAGASLPNGYVSIPPHLRTPVALSVNLASSRWNTSPQEIALTTRTSAAEYPSYATPRGPPRGSANGSHVGPHSAFEREQIKMSPRERAQDDTLALRQTISRLSQQQQDMQRKDSVLRAAIAKDVQSTTDEALDDLLKDVLHRRMELIKLDATIKKEQLDLERHKAAIEQHELFIVEGMKQMWYGLDAQGIRKTSELELNAARKAGEADALERHRRANINFTAKAQQHQNREAYLQSRESHMAIRLRESIEKEVRERLEASITKRISETAYERGFKEGKEVGRQEAVDEARARGFDDGYKEARRTAEMLSALRRGEIRGDNEELEFLVNLDHPQNPFNRGLRIGQRNTENQGLGIHVNGAPITQSQLPSTGQAQMQTRYLPTRPDQAPSHSQKGKTNGISVLNQGLVASGALKNGTPYLGTFSREARAEANPGNRGISSEPSDEPHVNGHRPVTHSAPPAPIQETVYSQIVNSVPTTGAGKVAYKNGVNKRGVESGKVYFSMTNAVPKNANAGTEDVYSGRKIRLYTSSSEDAGDDDNEEEEGEIKEEEANEEQKNNAGPKEISPPVQNLIDLE
ncbi:hypothetical protein BCR34DRAFT_607606 [Clohesyomyces aquaticus]|uniref:Uncharacterized protein n=1 Tax=Clohesyomyces aquaticus TaxID=1231657 RepID=A0A1Y1YF61_9PLEO|nr:hypothetical protein BCR34DRAFT_607606 [Clohesyomyces aquaticus]